MLYHCLYRGPHHIHELTPEPPPSKSARSSVARNGLMALDDLMATCGNKIKEKSVVIAETLLEVGTCTGGVPCAASVLCRERISGVACAAVAYIRALAPNPVAPARPPSAHACLPYHR